jgi:DNA primase
MNSPQTPIYDKSATLYGIDQASAAIKSQRTSVIVEGYMDVLIAHQTGHSNVVGASGTALTDKQADILKRLLRRPDNLDTVTPHIVLALDADTAGDLAALRGSALLGSNVRVDLPEQDELISRGPSHLMRIEARLAAEIRIMALPRGKDPDELLLEEPATWAVLLNEAQPVADHFIKRLIESLDLRTAHGKSEAVRQVAPVIRAIGDPVQRAHYIQKVAALTQSPLNIIQQAVARANSGRPPLPRGRNTNGAKVPATESAPVVNSRELTPEEHLLSLLLRYPDAMLLPEAPTPGRFTRSENRMIAETLAQVVTTLPPPGPGATLTAEDHAAIRDAVDPTLQEHYDFLLARAELEPYIYPFSLAGELTQRVRRLSAYDDHLWLQQCQLLLTEAQTTGDAETIARLHGVLDQMRPQLLQYTPARSTVFRDSRD